MKSTVISTFNLMLLLSLSLITSGCGGGSSSSPSTTTTPVSGVVMAGPASGASVSVKTASGTIVAGPVTTDTNGNFTVAVPTSTLSSDLVFEASGGTFTDEATTNAGVALGSASLTAYVAGGTLASGSNVTLDPSSTIVQKLVAGGKTRSAAFSAFSSAFGYKPDCTIKPAFANVSSAATTPQRLAGFRAAIFSQLTNDIKDSANTGIGGPAKQFELLQAIADDLSDGVLDGMKNGTPVKTASGFTIPQDILNQYDNSFINFLGNAAINKSKLTPDQVNAPPPNSLSLTTSYKVQYLPAPGGDVVGKDTFTLKISRLSDGSAATGLASSIVLNPVMVMMSMSGGTTWPNAVVETSTPGTYTGTVYYYGMATAGADMYWKLNVAIGAETAVFYPYLAALPTGNTISVKFSNSNDKTTGTTMRTYWVWRDSLSPGNGGLYNFTVFVSSTDGVNSLPVYAGQSWFTPPLAISTVTLLASTDGTTWVPLTPAGSNTGRYTANGLELMQGMSMPVYVKLNINGNVYTTNGSAYDNGTGISSNAVQTINVAP
jgi:hypothetical protein